MANFPFYQKDQPVKSLKERSGKDRRWDHEHAQRCSCQRRITKSDRRKSVSDAREKQLLDILAQVQCSWAYRREDAAKEILALFSPRPAESQQSWYGMAKEFMELTRISFGLVMSDPVASEYLGDHIPRLQAAYKKFTLESERGSQK